MPRGRWTAPGTAPWAYSSGSRTSKKSASPKTAAAPAGSISTMPCLAWLNISLKLATSAILFFRKYLQLKHYQLTQHSDVVEARSRGPSPSPKRLALSVSVPKVQLSEVVRRRKMVRDYSGSPVPAEVLDRVLDLAQRGPSAGFSQGVDLLVLEGPAQTGQFFELTSDPEFIAEPGRLAGLLRAPVIVVPLSDPAAYVSRYLEADKSGSKLAGVPAGSWPVPYWLVDSSFAVMLLLLAATDEGLGALFFRLHKDPGAAFRRPGCSRGQTGHRGRGPRLRGA